MRTHYAVYSIPHAAALWCGVPEDQLSKIIQEATQLSPSGLGKVYGCTPLYHVLNQEAEPWQKWLKMAHCPTW